MTRFLVLCAVLWVCSAQAAVIAPPEHRRSEAQTYLGFPAWYGVHSQAEYANFLAADRRPSDFPFCGHIGQLWKSYAQLTQITVDGKFNRSLNADRHAMALAAASSTTVEYALRSAYELTLGRLAELTRVSGPTSEERYAARTAQDYAEFIRLRPWYEFDFAARLEALWSTTGSVGADGVRKWERKYALSTEYAIKAAAAWIVGKVSRGSQDVPTLSTAVMVDRWVDRIAGNWPEMKRMRSFPDGGELVLLPRHHAFKSVAIAVARSGANFVEVAGNGPDARILLSVIVPRDWRPDSEGSVKLFDQVILSLPEQKRVALTVPVRELAQTLRELDGMQVTVEHVYDY